MTEPTIAQAGLKGLCPRCGAKTLYGDRWLQFQPRCSACGLDIAAFNVGDGPAAFLTLILGTLIVAAAVVLEVKASPPLWVHLLLWIPVTIASVFASLRIAKAALLAAEYRNRAEEGRLRK
jgi:uncharacterized protein (DUF983 family)